LEAGHFRASIWPTTIAYSHDEPPGREICYLWHITDAESAVSAA